MNPEDFSRGVYCAVADSLTFDPVRGAVEIVGSVTDTGVTHRIHVLALDVTHFSWDGRPKELNGLFELSTVEIRSQAAGWFVGFEPWSTSKLGFVCGTLQLNGTAVEGSGVWYQDSLDGPVPVSI